LPLQLLPRRCPYNQPDRQNHGQDTLLDDKATFRLPDLLALR